MIKHNQNGAVNGVVVSLILAIILLIAAIGAGAWAYNSRQDYKNRSDQKVAAAVTVAKQQESTAKDKQFAEESKNPLKTFQGPEAYGSLYVAFPKTWSGYVAASGNNSNPVDGYFASGIVPSVNDQNSVFALRIQVIAATYASSLQSLSGQQQAGKLTVSAYALPKLPKVVGVKAVGQLTSQGNNVTMIVLPLRSQTLKIWTEGDQYLDDFNKYIIPNLTFSP